MSRIFSSSIVADGKKFDKTLIKVKRLGEGGFGHCTSMLHKDSGLIIVKKISKIHKNQRKKRYSNYLKNEPRLMKQCSNPNVVKHIYSYAGRDSYIIYMEKADHGDLETYIKSALKEKDDRGYKLCEEAILTFLVQILRGLERIHREQILHRDIKLQNILVFKNDLVKICDFGISKTSQFGVTKIGDFCFVAPEVVKGKEYSYKVDIYSLGVVLYFLIYNKMFQTKDDSGPIERENIDELARRKGISTDLHGKCIHIIAIDLMKNMLNDDPEKRIKLKDILKSKIIKTALKELEKAEDKINKEQTKKVFNMNFKDLYSEYLSNKIHLKRCLFCGEKVIKNHVCSSLNILPEPILFNEEEKKDE